MADFDSHPNYFRMHTLPKNVDYNNDRRKYILIEFYGHTEK
jgi:hypothetical protein